MVLCICIIYGTVCIYPVIQFPCHVGQGGMVGMSTLLRHNIWYEQGKVGTGSFGCHSFILQLFDSMVLWQKAVFSQHVLRELLYLMADRL